MDHTGGSGGTTRVAGRRRTGECAGAPCVADALPVRARARAATVRFAGHMAGGRLASEVARASAATGARPVGANSLAAAVVPIAGRVAGRRAADEPTVVARRAGAGSTATPADDGTTASRQHECGAEARSEAHAHLKPARRSSAPPIASLADIIAAFPLEVRGAHLLLRGHSLRFRVARKSSCSTRTMATGPVFG
jgi:hypothetical protein